MEHRLEEYKLSIKDRVMGSIDFSREITDDELYEIIDREISEKLRHRAVSIEDKKTLRMQVFHSIKKLDVLQSLVDDPTITEIMVNGTDNIFIEKKGMIMESDFRFESRQKLEDVVQQIVASC